jgi:hypothetical protein
MVTASLGKKGGLGPSYSGVGLDPRRTPVICTLYTLIYLIFTTSYFRYSSSIDSSHSSCCPFLSFSGSLLGTL